MTISELVRSRSLGAGEAESSDAPAAAPDGLATLRSASFGDSPRLGSLPAMETVEEVRGGAARRAVRRIADVSGRRRQAWVGPVVRSGVAEEIGSRSALEDASVALDEVAALAGTEGPHGFYAVRRKRAGHECPRRPSQRSRAATPCAAAR
jgi:hypothetical protein